MVDDFSQISNKQDLNSRFQNIPKRESENWEEFFGRWQGLANAGEIIVGVMLNSSGDRGHLVMVTPGSLFEITGNEQSWGDSFVSRGIKKLPRVLECGGDDRETAAPLCRNVDRAGAIGRLKWFKYTK